MKNYYKHSIDLKRVEIRNNTRKNFVQKLEQIEYRGYEVEQLSDGRKMSWAGIEKLKVEIS